MTADHDLAAARVIEELGAIPDPPADLHAARLELRRRTRHVVVRRRLALVAVAAAAAVVGLVVFQALPHPRSTPLPAKHLQSGLPIGTLKGQSDYRTPEGNVPRFLTLVVRANATGTYEIRSQEDTGPSDPWSVRFVGDAPGRVILTRNATFCTDDNNELTLDFTIRDDKVTITRAAAGACSAFPDPSNIDLRGVVLRVVQDESPRP